MNYLIKYPTEIVDLVPPDIWRSYARTFAYSPIFATEDFLVLDTTQSLEVV